MRRFVTLLAALTLADVAGAGDIEHAEIGFEGATYRYVFITLLDGPADAVRAVVTDFERLGRINENITASKVLERYDDGSFKRLLRLEPCVIGICFELDFVERVVIDGPAISTTIVPGEGNFLEGSAQWRIDAVGPRRTRLQVRATQTPDFWIPPVIGPWVLKRVFLREVTETSERIERLAAAAR